MTWWKRRLRGILGLAAGALALAVGAVAASAPPGRGNSIEPLFAPGAAAARGESWPHTVEPGDTLIGLRDRLLVPGADWRVLQRLNRIAEPRRLMPGSTLQIPVDLTAARDLAAEVLHTQGEAWLQRRGAADRRPLTAGTLLDAGDLVGTGEQASAVIRFDDGSRVLLRPNSRLRLDRSVRRGPSERREVELQLQSGSADTQVPAPSGKPTRTRLQMRTPVVNLAVRGTEFRTQTNDQRTLLEVLDGRVAAAGALVDGGFGTVATAAGVAPGRSLLPPPDLGGLPERVERLPLDLGWPAMAGAAAYRAQVYDVAAGDATLRLDGLFAGPQARWPDDLPDGRYELRLRAADADGVEGRDATARFTLKARPEPPFVTEPRSGASTADETIVLRWTRNPAASRYRLQVADTPGFEPLRLERSDLVDTELRLDLPPGRHHWRLASVRGAGDSGPWGDVQTVTRLALPPPPPPVPPQAAADGVRLAWAKSPREGTTYRVQVARDSGFTDLVADVRTDQASWLLPSPEPGSYHVRMRTIDADGLAGAFGGAQQFDVPQTFGWWWWLPVLLLLVL
ncbi:MAG: FecR domain-containing protein [Burkholderiaceae bacterium]|nr:FecR domain-containing protein [Burkholderiaceae bacterium]